MAYYWGHSFCVGAATTVTRLGVLDLLIKETGRWKWSVTLNSGQQLAGAREDSLVGTGTH